MQYTTNYNMKKPDTTDTVNIGDLNSNADTIDTQMKLNAANIVNLAGTGRTTETVKGNADTINNHLSDEMFQAVGGTPTAITLTIKGTLVTGYPITFIASANNNGSATTINGKPLYKPGTTIAPTLIAGKAYTVWYNSSSNCFFIKASATGTASVGDVLANVTFSNDTDTDLTGTLTLTGSATDSNVLSGQTYYNTDAKTRRTGTMPNNGTLNYTPSSSIQNIPSGYISGGSVSAVTFNPSKVLNDTTIAGTTGTMVNHLHDTYATSVYADGYGALIPRIPLGAYLEEWGGTGVTEIHCQDSNFIPSNIVSGKSVFGLAGTATIESLGGKKVASGTTSGTGDVVITGLGFTPTKIFAVNQYGYTTYYYDYYKSLNWKIIGTSGPTTTSSIVKNVGNGTFTLGNLDGYNYFWYAIE